jgi:hypothetical protein
VQKALGLALVLSLFAITACGPESSSYTPTTDTISTTASIAIDGDSKMIHILQKGETVQSDKIEECSIGFDKEDLSYSVVSGEELTLDSQTLDFVRPLSSPANSKEDLRLFAVWKIPSQTVGQVSYNIEIEIQADKIIYRNTCIR